MISDVIKGHIRLFKISNPLFLRFIFCLTPNLLKTFQECQLNTEIIHKMKYDLKDHPRSDMTIFIINIRKEICRKSTNK